MDAGAMSGVAVARREGVIAAELTGGMADRGLDLACTPQTRFQIASVSKHFTAAAVLLLASRSQLSFDLATVGTGAGDVWCAAADLLRWDEAIFSGELLPANLREAMLAPQALTGTTVGRKGWSFTGYGYGWQIGTVAGRRAYFHTGDNSGYLAINVWLPDDQIALAVLANDQASDILQATDDLLELAT
jgi:CubicO group peptidase (beta-lactamase class C family)